MALCRRRPEILKTAKTFEQNDIFPGVFRFSEPAPVTLPSVARPVAESIPMPYVVENADAERALVNDAMA